MGSLGDRIRKARTAAGLSQNELARRADVRRQTVAAWERGDATPDSRNLESAAEACGLTLAELLDRQAPTLETPQTAPALKGWVSGQLKAINQGLNEYLEDIIATEAKRLVEAEWHRTILALRAEAPALAAQAVPILERLLGVAVGASATDRGDPAPDAPSAGIRPDQPASR